MRAPTHWGSMALIAAAVIAPARAADQFDAMLGTCWSCHGENGLPGDPTAPIIWGQRADYLEKQLRDFAGGDRDSQIMSSMAESIPPDAVAKVAAFLAAKPWPARAAASTSGAPEAIAACRACHGDTLMGGPSPEGAAPRLAGQNAEYLDDQMSAFGRGERANAKAMSTIMKSVGPDERAAIAKYLAGL